MADGPTACLNTPDIAPTFLGFLGLDVPRSMEGMDFSFIAETGEGPEPEAAFMQGMGHTFQWHDGDEWRAVRSKRYTYARMLETSAEYLFDNDVDPYQTENLIDDPEHADPRPGAPTWRLATPPGSTISTAASQMSVRAPSLVTTTWSPSAFCGRSQSSASRCPVTWRSSATTTLTFCNTFRSR